jgi:1,4-dihydroxy-6-naphthoate synthase
MSASEPLPIGFSPCPNDTWMFDALVRVPEFVPGLRPLPWLADIEALNERALAGEEPLAVTKLSAHGLFWVEHNYMVLRTGAALGRGCGPLVVAREPGELGGLAGRKIAIPGAYTTAHLLLRCFAPASATVVPMRFDRIMPAVAAGEVDAGLVIHEARFVFRDHGLVQVADLGEVWEAATGLPLPLGVIAAERTCEDAGVFEDRLRASVAAAWADPAASAAYVRAHAQEVDPEVCRRHIALYVNAFSSELGAEGRAAVETLLRRGAAVGMLPAVARPWR